ncbi:uncharacterized protein [Lepeophtheirus salmonis]|uniref:uncharacterized protein n=1 Tax=Lepeophtheirus salmonis TaxID=72036 RepID=UPI003AF383AD
MINYIGECWFLLFTICLVINIPENRGIKMLRVSVPDPLILGSAADLFCDFDMEGAQLYSVKWYKNGKEFFRYMADEIDPIDTLNVHGIYVDKGKSSANRVHLKFVRWSTEGRYKCEVTAGKPSYDTIVNTSNARIVAAPRHGPTITGQKTRYPAGGWVKLNCTANSSKPATELSWYINSIQAESSWIIHYPPDIGKDGRLTSTLGLSFRIRDHHYRNQPEIKIKCTAMLSPIYLKSNEISFEVKHPLKAPVLESRGQNRKNLEVPSSVYGGLVEIVDDENYHPSHESEFESDSSKESSNILLFPFNNNGLPLRSSVITCCCGLITILFSLLLE